MKGQIYLAISILAIIGYLAYDYFSKDKKNKEIEDIKQYNKILNIRIDSIDSTNIQLFKRDSILAVQIKNSNYKKSSQKYEQSSQQYKKNKANRPALPDFGN